MQRYSSQLSSYTSSRVLNCNNSSSSSDVDCYNNDNNNEQLLDEEAVSLLPFYFYIIVVAIVAILFVVVYIVSKHFRSHASVWTSSTDYSSSGERQQPELSDTMKSVVRSRVVETIFPTQIVQSNDLYRDPEADTVEWVKKKDGDCTTTTPTGSSSNNKQSNNKDATCSICIDHFKEGDVIATPSRCCHLFHHDCILGWSQLKSECPVCRQAMWESDKFAEIEMEMVKKLLSQPPPPPHDSNAWLIAGT